MNRIRELRNSKGLKQIELSKMLGVTQGALSSWENSNYEPDITALNMMADLFGVSVDYILGRASSASSSGVLIPVLGYIQAGVPVEAVEDILDYEEITKSMAASGNFFALRVRGDSMEPRFKENDVVIVRKQEDVDSGSIAVVFVNGDDATIKKLVKHSNGISLVALNPAYSPMFYTPEEVSSLPITVIGRVEELRAKF